MTLWNKLDEKKGKLGRGEGKGGEGKGSGEEGGGFAGPMSNCCQTRLLDVHTLIPKNVGVYK